MTKKDYYTIQKNVDKIKREGYTNFLDPNVLSKVCSKLKGYTYQIYYPYKESEKAIIYTKKTPKIRLLEIITEKPLKHNEIMGSLFSLNIDSETFGDIIVDNNKYYIMIMDSIYPLINSQLNMVGNNHIQTKEVPLGILNNYQRKYKEINLIVSSLRIDTIISRLIGTSREDVKKKFLNEEIILNYEPCHKLNYNLNTNDIFSIRKYGKYKFDSIIKTTKKDSYIIKIYKYI